MQKKAPILLVSIFLAYTMTLWFTPQVMAQSTSASYAPQLLSQSAILMNLNTGQILYEKNPHQHLYPASITKIMTALLALKYGHLNDLITTSVNAANQVPNKVYLVPGEVHTLKQMLYGLLIDSGNDAAVAIAEHYGHSVKGFASMMNKEAKKLGALDTHFTNPSGLQNANLYTSSYDMALIAKRAMKIPEFRKIVSTKYYLWKGKEWTSYLSNLNGMLWTYPGANGVKTGWTTQAEETMVVTATQKGQTLLAVLMKVPLLAQMQTDATNLLNYGFSSFHSTEIVPAGTKVFTLAIRGYMVPVSLAQPLTAQVSSDSANPAIKIVIPNTLRVIHVVQGLEIIRNGSSQTPTDSRFPTLRTLTIAPLSQGIERGAVVGSVTFSYQHMLTTLPLQIDASIPVTKSSPMRPPLIPEFSLAVLSFLAAAIARTNQRTKNSNKVRAYSRAINKS